MNSRWKCTECGHICTKDEILKEHHPFREGDMIWGCPACLDAESLEQVCEVDGCDEFSSCGWPDAQGEYHRTCGKHMVRGDAMSQLPVGDERPQIPPNIKIPGIEHMELSLSGSWNIDLEGLFKLQPGTIVRHKVTGDSFVVTGNHLAYVIAVRTVHISNPSEWEVVDVKRGA